MNMRSPDKIFAFGVSPSMLKKWLLCRKRWYNEYILGLKAPRDVKGVYMVFGLAWDAFIKQYFISEMEIDQLIGGFKQDFPESLDSDKRTQELGIRMIRQYIKSYPRDTEPIKLTKADIKGQVPVEGLDLPLNVILDGVGIYRESNWVIEYKTTSRLGATYFNQFKVDFQTDCYVYFAQKNFNEKYEGVLFDVAGCKKIVNRDSFLRDDTVGCKTQVQIDFSMKQFAMQAQSMLDYVRKHWTDPSKFGLNMSSNACFSFNVTCPYLEACQFGDNVNLVKHKFEKKEKVDIGNILANLGGDK